MRGVRPDLMTAPVSELTEKERRIRCDVFTASMSAEAFVSGVEYGVSSWKDVRGWHTPFNKQGAATGFVYFVGTGPGDRIDYVKIGFTSGDPQKRLKALQTGCPTKIVMLGFVFGDEQLERDLQMRLIDHNTSGEWYLFNEIVRRAIRRTLNKDSR